MRKGIYGKCQLCGEPMNSANNSFGSAGIGWFCRACWFGEIKTTIRGLIAKRRRVVSVQQSKSQQKSLRI